MQTFLIEIPHSANTFECKQVIKLFVESGSHLLANAYWGCRSGVHKSWYFGEFESKDEALMTVPPFLRHTANIVEMTRFTKEDIQRFAQENAHTEGSWRALQYMQRFAQEDAHTAGSSRALKDIQWVAQEDAHTEGSWRALEDIQGVAQEDAHTAGSWRALEDIQGLLRRMRSG